VMCHAVSRRAPRSVRRAQSPCQPSSADLARKINVLEQAGNNATCGGAAGVAPHCHTASGALEAAQAAVDGGAVDAEAAGEFGDIAAAGRQIGGEILRR